MSDIRWHEMTTTEISERFRQVIAESNKWRTTAHLLAHQIAKTTVDKPTKEILDEAYRQAVTSE